MSEICSPAAWPTAPPPDAVTPTLGDDGLVVEGLLTTVDDDGQLHVAPMGPVLGQRHDWAWLRPFPGSTSCGRLRRTGAAVFHSCDDVELLAAAAVGQLTALPAARPATKIRGLILEAACRWWELSVASWDDRGPRIEVACRVVAYGENRPFLGFNRAKHAVVEGAILATRVGLAPPGAIGAELSRLAPWVEKTGGAAERRAWAMLVAAITARLDDAAAATVRDAAPGDAR